MTTTAQMSRPNEIIVSEQALLMFCISVLTKLGVSKEHSSIWAEGLIEASLRGVDSHGILVLPIYASILEAGGIRRDAKIEVLAHSGSTVLLDGGGGIGSVIATHAVELAVERAGQTGLGFVAVKNSNHFGTAGHYAMKSLNRNMIGLALTNAAPQISAWGGRSKVIGSNAMAIAVPAGEELPVVLDIAIGASSAAKIFLAAEKGEQIPTDWMIDKDGRPTDNPQVFFDGGVIQPFGKHKGYGLGLIVDVLTGVLSGGLFSTSVERFSANPSEPLGICHSFAALDIKRFIPVNQFKKRMDEMIRNVKRSEPLEGVDRVYLPGERGFLTREDRLKNGIPLHAKLAIDLKRLAARLAVEIPF